MYGLYTGYVEDLTKYDIFYLQQPIFWTKHVVIYEKNCVAPVQLLKRR